MLFPEFLVVTNLGCAWYASHSGSQGNETLNLNPSPKPLVLEAKETNISKRSWQFCANQWEELLMQVFLRCQVFFILLLILSVVWTLIPLSTSYMLLATVPRLAPMLRTSDINYL